MFQERLKHVHSLVHEIEDARKRSEYGLENIEKIQEEINVEEELNSVDQRKLKFIYTRAVDDAKQEEELLRDALDKIDEIRSIINQRRLQVKKNFSNQPEKSSL